MRLRLPSPAMVVALISLAVALGGVGYAASVLPPKSVTTRELADGAVTGAKVKDGSLLARDFRAGQLPAGTQGPQGLQGPQGPAGPSGSAGVLSASVSGSEVGKVLFKDAGTGVEVRVGASGRLRLVNTSDDTKVDVRGVGYYGTILYPVTITLTPGQSQDVVFDGASFTFGTFLITRDVPDAPRLALTCTFKDSITPALVRLACVGAR